MKLEIETNNKLQQTNENNALSQIYKVTFLDSYLQNQTLKFNETP